MKHHQKRRRYPLASCLLAGLMLLVSMQAMALECGDSEVLPELRFPQVVLETSLGDITLELDRRRAPLAVNNFLRYAQGGFYNGTVFHRVIRDFVVQGGGYQAGFEDRDTCPPVFNESGNGLRNTSGTIAMARHDDPHSATSQFYINLVDNPSLDPERSHWGYTVFGQVMDGFDVLQRISEVATDFSDELGAPDVPIESVTLKQVRIGEP